jgi:hypothetical protein
LYDKDYLQKGLKSRNAAVAAIKVFPMPEQRIGYVCDFSVGAFETYNHGSNEISVGFSIPSSSSSSGVNQVSCRKFF